MAHSLDQQARTNPHQTPPHPKPPASPRCPPLRLIRVRLVPTVRLCAGAVTRWSCRYPQWRSCGHCNQGNPDPTRVSQEQEVPSASDTHHLPVSQHPTPRLRPPAATRSHCSHDGWAGGPAATPWGVHRHPRLRQLSYFARQWHINSRCSRGTSAVTSKHLKSSPGRGRWGFLSGRSPAIPGAAGGGVLHIWGHYLPSECYRHRPHLGFSNGWECTKRADYLRSALCGVARGAFCHACGVHRGILGVMTLVQSFRTCSRRSGRR